MYKEQRRPRASTFWDHGILPQEILERSAAIQVKYDCLGTNTCRGCGRELHQDSFQCLFKAWRRGQLCYTCVEAKGFADMRRYEEPKNSFGMIMYFGMTNKTIGMSLMITSIRELQLISSSLVIILIRRKPVFYDSR